MYARNALGYLYVLLFICFGGLSVCQPVARWISVEFGLWAMIGALAVYAASTLGTIWLINKVNRDWPVFEVPKTPANMVETMTTGYEQQASPSSASQQVRLSFESDNSIGPKA